jgi:hypothetical protein
MCLPEYAIPLFDISLLDLGSPCSDVPVLDHAAASACHRPLDFFQAEQSASRRGPPLAHSGVSFNNYAVSPLAFGFALRLVSAPDKSDACPFVF